MQIKKGNGSAKQNGSKQEKREGPEVQDWVPQKPPCFAVVAEQTLAVTKSGTGTRGRGTRGRGVAGRGDVGTRDAGTWDARTLNFAIYSFRWLTERYYMMESLPAD